MNDQRQQERHPGLSTAVAASECRASAADRATLVDDLVVAFAVDHDAVRAEQHAIEQWVDSWLARAPDATVAMACRAGARGPQRANRARRAERLRGLRDALARAGVPADRIRYTADELGRDPLPSAVAPGTVQMKVLKAEALDVGVAPIATLFVAPEAPRSTPCTSAS